MSKLREGTADAQSAKPAKAKPDAGAERIRWGTFIRPDLLLGVRMLALKNRVSPFDVLENALSTYLADAEIKR